MAASIMRLVRLWAGVAAVTAMMLTASASASAQPLCGDLGGDWGTVLPHSVTSERKAVRDIKMAVPGDLVGNPTSGPAIRECLHN